MAYTAGACLAPSILAGGPARGGYLPRQSAVHNPPVGTKESSGKQTWASEKQQSRVFCGKKLVCKED